jgi:outer membrane protein assembly factor BamA
MIKCEVGMEFDSTLFKEDEQILRNLNLFFNVDGKYVWNEALPGWDITFYIKEAKYLYPIASISGFEDQLKLQLGANHINFSGKGDQLGFLYQYYDRHSFSLFHNAPRHRNLKTGHELALSKYSTVEPLYFVDTVSSFNFDNYSFSAGGFYWLNRHWQMGTGGMVMYERYRQLDSAFTELGMQEFTFFKYQIRTKLMYTDVNQRFEFRDGKSVEFYVETIQTPGVDGASFFKGINEFRWYKKLGNRGNMAFRNRLAIATNNFSPFSPFVIDGFINVRGAGNRVARGTAELVANFEHRHTIYRHKWFLFQAVAFSDFGTLRPPGGKFEEMFEPEAMHFFVGSGLRLHSRVLYNVVFRLDYGFSPLDTRRRGFSFGVGQFF